MLEYVPVNFSLYRQLKPCLRWTLQCLVAFADRAGKCWPSVRTLAKYADSSRSSVSRHLKSLANAGVISRERRPGGGYTYRIDARFLPAGRGVSHAAHKAVPPAPKEENPIKKISDHGLSRKEGSGQQQANRDQSHYRSQVKDHLANQINVGQIDDSSRWEARLRGWQKRRFWSNFWGPRPDQPGCWAPATSISSIIARAAATGPAAA